MSRTRPTTAQRVLVLLDEHRTHAPGRKSLYTEDLAERLPAAEAAELAEALVELRKLQLIEELWTARITTAPRPVNFGPWRLALGTERHVDRARKVAAAFDALPVPPLPPPPEPEMKTSPPTDTPTPAIEGPANGPARAYTMDGCDLWERKFTRPAMLSLLASLGGPVRLDHLVDWMIEARSDREADELRTVLRAGARGAAQAGLVTIERDADDRNVVALTPRGEAVLEVSRGTQLPGSRLHIEDIMSHRVYDGQALYPETPELPGIEAVEAVRADQPTQDPDAPLAVEPGPGTAEVQAHAMEELLSVTRRVVGGLAYSSPTAVVLAAAEALDATLASEAAAKEHIRRLEIVRQQDNELLNEVSDTVRLLDRALDDAGQPHNVLDAPPTNTAPEWLQLMRGLYARVLRLRQAKEESQLDLDLVELLLRDLGFPREVDVPDPDSPDPAPVRTSLALTSRVEWLHRELVSAKARADAGSEAVKDLSHCHVALSEAGLPLNSPCGGLLGRVLELVRQRNSERTRVADLEAVLAKTPITPAAPAEGGDPGAQSVIEAASKLLDEADVPARNDVTDPETGETLTVHFGLYDRIQMLAEERSRERGDAQREGRLRVDEQLRANGLKRDNVALEHTVATLREALDQLAATNADLTTRLADAAAEARTWTLDRLDQLLEQKLERGVQVLELQQMKTQAAKEATYDAFQRASRAIDAARHLTLPPHLGGPCTAPPQPTHGEGA